MRRPLDSYTNPIPTDRRFGAYRNSLKGYHEGTDYCAPIGTPVRATARGKIRAIAYSGPNEDRASWSARVGFGHSVYVDFFDSSGTLVRYSVDAHLRDAPVVSVRQWVNEGQLLGYVGKTGNAWPAYLPAHTHHAEYVKVRGLWRAVDPEGLFPSFASSTITPIDNEEDDMTPEQSAQLAAVATQVEALSAAVFTGGTSMEDGQRSISRSLASIQKEVGRSVWGYLTASAGRNGNRVSFAQMIRDLEVVVRRIDAKQPQAAPAQQWSADEFTAIIKAELAADSFDDAAADRIAAKVSALVTFPTVEETAEATADEIDERERERLGLGA